MTKSASLAVAIWAAALVALGGLAYALGRPLEPRSSTLEPVDAIAAAPAPAAPKSNDRIPPPLPIIEMPVVEIVGYVSGPVRRAAAPPPPPRELSAMHCSEWRELLQGSPRQRVQLCE